MKVYLRNTLTGLFYGGPEQWTTESTRALEFPAPDTALDIVSNSKLPSMEVVIHFEDAQFNLPLTIVGLGK
jgi:hypothetical protein